MWAPIGNPLFLLFFLFFPGVKFNYTSGQPAPESITDKIYGFTTSIKEIRIVR